MRQEIGKIRVYDYETKMYVQKCLICGKPMSEHMMLSGGDMECPENDKT